LQKNILNISLIQKNNVAHTLHTKSNVKAMLSILDSGHNFSVLSW